MKKEDGPKQILSFGFKIIPFISLSSIPLTFILDKHLFVKGFKITWPFSYCSKEQWLISTPIPDNKSLLFVSLDLRPHFKGSPYLISYVTFLSRNGSSFKFTKWGVPANLALFSSYLLRSSSSSLLLVSISFYSYDFSISSIAFLFASICSFIYLNFS